MKKKAKVRKYQRKIVGAKDGDDIIFKRRLQGSKVGRLAGVRAQELKKRGGKKAKKTLNKLVKGKTARVKVVGKSYGRPVVKVKIKRKNINKMMRKKGYTNKGR